MSNSKSNNFSSISEIKGTIDFWSGLAVWYGVDSAIFISELTRSYNSVLQFPLRQWPERVRERYGFEIIKNELWLIISYQFLIDNHFPFWTKKKLQQLVKKMVKNKIIRVINHPDEDSLRFKFRQEVHCSFITFPDFS